MPDNDERLRAEARYIAGGITLEQLAAELGVTRRTVERWSREYKWGDKRKRVMNRARKKAENRISTRIAKKLERIDAASEKAEVAADIAAQALIDKFAEDIGNGDRVDLIGAIDRLAGALEKLAGTRMKISGILSAGEKEKIKALHERLEMEKANAAKGQPGSVRIELSEALEELAE